MAHPASPRSIVVVRREKMKNLVYTLKCQQCGKGVLYDRRGGAANFMIKRGFRSWHFCTAKCRDEFREEHWRKPQRIIDDIIRRSRS
jgi:hypothetical protein